MDLDTELAALSSAPCPPAQHRTSHPDDDGLNLETVSQPQTLSSLRVTLAMVSLHSNRTVTKTVPMAGIFWKESKNKQRRPSMTFQTQASVVRTDKSIQGAIFKVTLRVVEGCVYTYLKKSILK